MNANRKALALLDWLTAQVVVHGANVYTNKEKERSIERLQFLSFVFNVVEALNIQAFLRTNSLGIMHERIFQTLLICFADEALKGSLDSPEKKIYQELISKTNGSLAKIFPNKEMADHLRDYAFSGLEEIFGRSVGVDLDNPRIALDLCRYAAAWGVAEKFSSIGLSLEYSQVDGIISALEVRYNCRKLKTPIDENGYIELVVSAVSEVNEE